MSRWVAALRLVGVGFFIGGSILLGTFLGIWLDSKLNTKPLLTVIGLFLGLIVAGFGVYQMLIPVMGGKQNGDHR